jgi:hypothetical protein
MDAETLPLAGKLYRYFVLAIAVALVGNLGARVLVEASVGPPWLVAIAAVATVIPLVLVAIRFRRMLRELDELLQRVLLEGFSIALVVLLPIAALYINLSSAGINMPRLDAPEVMMTPALLVLIGLQIAWRRYR